MIFFGRAAVEMQMVFYDQDLYQSYQQALPNEDGVVILAVQFQFINYATEITKNYNFLFKYTDKISQAGEAVDMDLQDLDSIRKLFADVDTKTYFSYHGSLTRPPCSNSVNWLILRNKSVMSDKQVLSSYC